MPVSVAAHPGTEPDSRQSPGRNQRIGVIPRIGPGLSEPQVDIVQDAWKDFLEIINHVPPFLSYARFDPVHFAGSPEPFQGHLDLVPYGLLLLRRPHLVFTSDHQTIECAMLFEDGEPLRLGWMSC